MTEYQRHSYLQALGIPIWVSRVSAEQEKVVDSFTQSRVDTPTDSSTISTQVPSKTEVAAPALVDSSQMDWETLQTHIAACQQCALHTSRNQAISGMGDVSARFMVIGDAPSTDDDRENHPLAGRAGLLLSKMLLAINLPVANVFITHTTKCRPPNDRTPFANEQHQCQPYLDRQIEKVKPEFVLILGRASANYLLQCKEPLSKLRGQVHSLPDSNIPAIVTYHPRNLLKKPSDKRKAWEDLKLFRKMTANEHRKFE